ncbi:MAG: ribonuclease E/G, partial [Desulfovibrio sp.]|nr:ribonuclease E/G [Desulfovibrio sp.]
MTADQNIAPAAAGSGEHADAPAIPAKKPRRRARKTPGATAASQQEQTVTRGADPAPPAPRRPAREKASAEAAGGAGQRRQSASPRRPGRKTAPAAAAPAGAIPQPPDGQEHASREPVQEPSAAPQKEIAAEEPAGRKNPRGRGAKTETPGGKRRMLVSVLPGEQVEVALVEDGVVQEYYLDMLHQRKIKGNIYKGVVQNIDTNLQAAFVNFGAGKNGFLQIDEIHPEYWQAHHEPAKGRKLPPIQKVLKVGQDVLAQVVKEPTGNKGAFLTTWLSLAGRFLVLTPGQEQTGVSRKVEDEEERGRLRELMGDIDPGPELGVIVRTVSEGVTKTTQKIDLQYLKRVCREI